MNDNLFFCLAEVNSKGFFPSSLFVWNEAGFLREYIALAWLWERKDSRGAFGRGRRRKIRDTFDYIVGRGAFEKRRKKYRETLSGHGGVVGLLLAEYEPSNLAVLCAAIFSAKSVVQWLKKSLPRLVGTRFFGSDEKSIEVRVE